MAESAPNPYVYYIIPAIALAALLVWFLYGVVDRVGLDSQRAQARVTGKRFATGSTTYNQNIVAGRAHVQSTQNPDAYVIGLDLDGETTGGAVSPQLYETLQPGDMVDVEFQRTRISGQIVITGIRR